MKRRSFLSILGAVSVAPVLPLPAAASPVAAGYNRYMYGLAVFQARTRASLSAPDLVAKLRVSPTVADAMMGEMQRKGVLAPALNAATGATRAVSPTPQRRSAMERVVRRAVDYVTEDAPVREVEDTATPRDSTSPAYRQ